MKIFEVVVASLMMLGGSQAGLLELTDANFQSEVLDSGKSSFVKFYAPWCGHCKKLAPTWSQLAEDLEGASKAQIVKVDCTVHKSTCSKYGVTGYPALKYFTAGESEPSDYKGGRSLEQLKDFVKETLDGGCDVTDLESCDEREAKYIEKMKAKGPEKIKSELARLTTMSDGKMAPDLKKWLATRKTLLTQLAA